MGKYINKTKFIIVEFHEKNTFKGYDPNKIHQYLIKNKFVLKKKYRFPLLNFEDRIYKRNAWKKKYINKNIYNFYFF